MANAIIDPSVIQRLLETRLETVSGVSIIHPGEADPTTSSAWARYAGMKLNRRRRQRGGTEIDVADFEAGITVVIGESQPSGFAAADAAGRIAAVFDGATLVDPATGTVVHQVDIHEVQIELVPDPDPAKGIRAAIVSPIGLAQRWSGTSAENHLS